MQQPPSSHPSARLVSLPVETLSLIVESLEYAQEHLQELKDVSQPYAIDSADTVDKLMCEQLGVQIAIMEELVSMLKPKLPADAA